MSEVISKTLLAKERDMSMDILRSGAILYIVGFWHLCSYSASLSFYYTNRTRLLTSCIMGVFFFVSGFLISRKYNDGYANIKSIAAFYKRRILRIYPLYAIALTGFMLGGSMGRGTYVKAIFLSSAILNEDPGTLWFINVIFIFYLITPLFLIRFRLDRAILYTLGLCIALLALHKATGLIDTRLPKYLIAFSFGIILARSSLTHEWLDKHIWLPLLCFIAFGWISTFKDYSQEDMAYFVIYTLSILSSIPIILLLGKKLSPIFSQRTIRFLSYSSFAMYLFHPFIFKAAIMVYKPHTIATSIIYLISIVLPVIILVSYFIQLAYDTAFNKLFPSLQQQGNF